MKILLSLLLVCCLSQSAFAQRVYFSDTTNKWITSFTYNTGGASGNITSYTDYHYADSIAEWQGKSYHVLMRGQNAFALVREDTLLQKVFLRPLDTMFGDYLKARTSDEFIYMDYNLGENDTLDMPLTYDMDTPAMSKHVVTGVDSVLMNNIWHKVFHINVVSGFEYGGSYTWIEGIGSSNTGPVIAPAHPPAGQIKRIICFKNEGIFPIDSLSGCDVSTGTDNANLNAISFEIFPNPAFDNLSIVANLQGNKKDCSASLSDELGRTVYSRNFHQRITLDVSGLAEGVYFLRLAREDQAIVRKIIIRH